MANFKSFVSSGERLGPIAPLFKTDFFLLMFEVSHKRNKFVMLEVVV